MKILFFADVTHPTAAVYDHVQAIVTNSSHEWLIKNPLTCRVLHKLDFSLFDAIGMHYSIRPHHRYYLPRALYKKIKEFKGRKFQFIQDEYSQVKLTMDTMADLDISLVYTLVRPELVRKAYSDPRLLNTQFVTILTGYIPEGLHETKVPPIKDRTTDIFYRSRVCPYWLGRLAQDKVCIAEGFRVRAQDTGLKIDVSVLEEDRIYGDEWVRRLSNAKAVLGTESGASIWDFTGEVEQKTRKYMQEHPYASFEEVEEKLLKTYEANLLYTAISPRVFEAAALKTPMVMFPGWYSGVCEADKHYILLEKDFSNFAQVLEKLKDTNYLQALADRTYQDLILSGKYNQNMLAHTVDASITPVSEWTAKNSTLGTQEYIDEIIQKNRFLHFYHGLRMELIFAAQNFFRILFDPSTPLHRKFYKLSTGAQRYLIYLKPRLMLLFARK